MFFPTAQTIKQTWTVTSVLIPLARLRGVSVGSFYSVSDSARSWDAPYRQRLASGDFRVHRITGVGKDS